MSEPDHPLVTDLLGGDRLALARAITRIENRDAGYRDLVAALHRRAGDAAVVGVTGSPGAGKSTLVNRLVAAYRERGEAVGVVAVDPSSPFTGGAVLGDRVRMDAARGDDGVFVRSMSTRGTLGGLSNATGDAVTALDAAGFDRVIVETVGAGQSEVDVMSVADTVAVLLTPGSGDDVQMLKAGVLEIADVFVVNKADRDGVDRVVRDLRDMLSRRDRDGEWEPPIVETVATRGEGVADLVAALADHRDHLAATGERERRARDRYAAEIRTLLREDAGRLLEAELDRRGGVEALAERVADRETDPYAAADEVLEPLRDCLAGRGE
ncbi:MAG: methylmalonyl Co-A mutase-associated GTPase MeaB [Halobacteriaceae archaeon]